MVIPVLGVMLCSSQGLADDDWDAILQERNFKIRIEAGRKMVDVSLKDLLGLALDRSLLLQDARKGEISAERSLEASQERNMPILSNSFEVGQTVNQGLPSIAVLLGLAPVPLASLTSTQATSLISSVRKQLTNGIQYGLTYAEVRTQSKSVTIADAGDTAAAGSYGDPLEYLGLTASVVIPFFQDWGEVNDIPVFLGQVGVKQAQAGTRMTQYQIIRAVASLYWDLVGLLETIKVQEEAVALTRRLLKDNKALYQVGLLSRSDIQATETQLARQRQELLSLRTAVLRMEDLVRTSLDLTVMDVGMVPSDVPRVREVEVTENLVTDRMYENDTNLEILNNNLEQLHYELLQVQNKEKTNLDLSLAYTMGGYSSSPLGGVNGFSDQETNGFNARLTWVVPLFDKSTPKQIQKVRLDLERVQLKIQNRRSELKIQLQSILRSLSLAREQVQTSRTAMEMADEQMQNTIRLLKQGKATSFQVSQAQQQASVARQQEIFSRVDFEKQFFEFLIITGDVFSYYQLENRNASISEVKNHEK